MIAEYPQILDQLKRGKPIRLTPIGGGCIAHSLIAIFEDSTEVFVKSLAHQPGMFQAEAHGLLALAESNSVRIPRVLGVSEQALVLERIREGRRTAEFDTLFGQQLASLHQFRGKTCGFNEDNFIGLSPQCNTPIGGSWANAHDQSGSTWPDFFIERRLRFQTRLASERGYGPELNRLLDRAELSIRNLLVPAIEPPCLLHGDLWSGNYLVDEHGAPCLIDPAVYFGHRETDLAMTRLFGGFGPAFYSSYQNHFPLLDGHEHRLPIYQLYHVINHLNLFGGSYFSQAKSILEHLSG